jgi:hypothetical protein
MGSVGQSNTAMVYRFARTDDLAGFHRETYLYR